MSLNKYWLLMLVPLALAGADKDKNKKKPPAASAPAAQQTVIPKDAKQVEPYTYRHTDAQGKTWIYRRTPFGVVRFPEPAADAQPAEQIPPGMTAVEEGDSIRFERPTPFGKHRWIRKKSELTELERKVWERDRQKDAPPKGNPEE